MRTLWENVHARIEVDEGRRVLCFTRSSVPFETIDAVKDTFANVARVVGATFDPTVYALLVDMRQAAGRNDPEFERATAQVRDLIVRRFQRRATLVRTAAGRLQVQRIARQNGDEVHVFDDREAAIAFLTGPPPVATKLGSRRGPTS